MSLSVHSAAAAIAAHAKVHGPHGKAAGGDLNPAQQAKAADPAVKGADFGALVSQFARAKHAPPAPVAPTAPPPAETAVDIVV
ncbi:MAG: hypothetical protein ACREE0_10600 [Phenylobacterium sp.]